jgi:hypothetical protein
MPEFKEFQIKLKSGIFVFVKKKIISFGLNLLSKAGTLKFYFFKKRKI